VEAKKRKHIYNTTIYNKTNNAKISKAKWRDNPKNKQSIVCQRRKWKKNQWKNNIVYKMKTIVSNNIRIALKENKHMKNFSTWKILPYSPQQLKEHLEAQFDSNMSWENYGTYWHIDHIYPQSKLPYDSIEHPNFKKCWSLFNLRPLEAKENLRKSNKIIKGEKNV